MKKELNGERCTKLVTTRPVIIITTLHKNGVVNAGVFGSYTNLSSREIGIAIGKPSHTYENIKRSKELVINVPGKDLVDALSIIADNVPAEKSELDLAGLSTIPSVNVSVPHIKECKASIECRYIREHAINYHSFVIVEVIRGIYEEGLLDEEGCFDVVKAQVLHCSKYPRAIYTTFGGYIEGK